MNETKYQIPIASAWSGDKSEGIVLERIQTKETGMEEIRLAWWRNGYQCRRPADVDACEWPDLFRKAVENGVFNRDELREMMIDIANNL